MHHLKDLLEMGYDSCVLQREPGREGGSHGEPTSQPTHGVTGEAGEVLK